MASLTKCIYGLQTDPKKTPFGLLNNQVKLDNIIQSAGWFNIKGERLGCGDLTIKDMANISKHIASDEVFIAISEASSEWDMPNHLDRTAPGFDYVMSKAVWVMAKSNFGDAIIRIRDDIDKQETSEKDGIKYLRLPRSEFYRAMTQPLKAPQKMVDSAEPDTDTGAKTIKRKSTISSTYKSSNTVSPASPKQMPLPATTAPATQPQSPKMGSAFTSKPLKKTTKGFITP